MLRGLVQDWEQNSLLTRQSYYVNGEKDIPVIFLNFVPSTCPRFRRSQDRGQVN